MKEQDDCPNCNDKSIHYDADKKQWLFSSNDPYFHGRIVRYCANCGFKLPIEGGD